MATVREPRGATWPTPAVASRQTSPPALRSLPQSIDAGPEHLLVQRLVGRDVAEEAVEIGGGAGAAAFVQPRNGREHADDLRLLRPEFRGSAEGVRIVRAIAAVPAFADGVHAQAF